MTARALGFLVMAALSSAIQACAENEVDGRSRQRLGLQLTGLGKSASVELPVERRNTGVTYVFGGTMDVRQPPSVTAGSASTTIATYATEFEPRLFTRFTDAGAFIEDVSFAVGEAPRARCAELALPRRVTDERMSLQTTAVPRTLGGRSWTETAEIRDATETHLRHVSHTFSTELVETNTCLTLSIRLTERTAPPGPDDRTKYSRYDSSPRAQDANQRLRAHALKIAEDAAASFAIR